MTFPGVRIVPENISDEATLTADPAFTSTMPVTIMQQANRKNARSLNIDEQEIKGVWPSLRVISCCILYAHNLTSAATWQVQLFENDDFTDIVFDSTEIYAKPGKSLGELEWGIDPLGASVFTNWALAFSQIWFSAVRARSFIITLKDPENTDAYIDIRRLIMGFTLEPTYSADWGVELGWNEDTQTDRTASGTLRSDPSPAGPYRELTISFSFPTSGERAKLMEFVRKVGKRKDFFISCCPTQGGAKERDFAMLAKMPSTLPKFKEINIVQRGAFTLNIEET